MRRALLNLGVLVDTNAWTPRSVWSSAAVVGMVELVRAKPNRSVITHTGVKVPPTWYVQFELPGNVPEPGAHPAA